MHAWRAHGKLDAAIALILPPYGVYRGIEGMVGHRQMTDEDIATIAETEDGRRALSAQLLLKPEVWTAVLAGIEREPTHEHRTTMEESGQQIEVYATVSAQGPATVSIVSPGGQEGLLLTIVDADRDQSPEAVRIRKTVNGVQSEQETALTSFTTADASQFQLAWSLAWGQIAQERNGR